MVANLETALWESLDSHAPEKSKVITCRPKCPWYTSEIKHQEGVVKHKEKIWRKYREDDQWIAYKVKKRKYNQMFLESKQITISDKVNQCNRDTKQLFRLVNEISSSTEDNPLPDEISNQELANQFADYFINKIQIIRDNLNNYDKYCVDHAQHIPTFGKIEPLMEDEVTKIIMGMASKSCESDPVPTTLLKEILPQVIKLITKTINTSLELGFFASQWKVALVKPLLKKVGLALVAPNYHPVSNLPFLSKVLERCVVNQFTAHCNTKNLFPGYQLAYRRNYSCEMALIKIINDCLWAMENQMVTVLVAVDLSAAFDTVDHEMLLEVLNKKFGLQNCALWWFGSYLRLRSCKVSVHGVHSKEHQIPFLVHQGSAAGPVLYNAYASTLQQVVQSPIKLHGFTDDHAIKDSFMPITSSKQKVM